jgi:ribosome-associated protein
MPVLVIGASAPLSEDELTFRHTRSGGPGGQHVNTTATRVELVFDVAGSPTLTDAERDLGRRLRTRLDSEGRLRIVAQDERSRARNRALAVERFCAVMRRRCGRRRLPAARRGPPAAREERLDEAPAAPGSGCAGLRPPPTTRRSSPTAAIL